jgi:glycosyltransferase involved in cell wall biosynthesis
VLQPKLSVIISVYNEKRDLQNCLDSLSKQNYSNYEVIVVDDGSTDNSAEIAANHHVGLIKQKHLGVAHARNNGANKAEGDILIFVDADMTFTQNFLTRLVDPIVNKGVIGTFSKDEYVANKTTPLSDCWCINKNIPIGRMHPLNYPDSQPVFRAIRKSDFISVGGFDSTGYNDDWTLARKLKALAVNAPGAVFYHRNPDTYSEIWSQSAWIARRNYKLGVVGKAISMFRVSLPVSMCIGFYKSVKFSNFYFIPFKIIYDFAAFTSLLKSFFSSKLYK